MTGDDYADLMEHDSEERAMARLREAVYAIRDAIGHIAPLRKYDRGRLDEAVDTIQTVMSHTARLREGMDALRAEAEQ